MKQSLLPLLLLAGCASVKPIGPGLTAPTVDWPAAGDEAVDVLSRYLRVDTINPPGNETRGAQFLAEELAKDGIESSISEFAPGRGSLIARVRAPSPTEKPLCLLSHIDVVTANDSDWPEDAQPLSGVVKDGAIWGRGALDMKGMGVIELQTLRLLKRTGAKLKRDVILIAVADEEVDNGGMHHVVDTKWDELDCGVMLNEGGIGLPGLLFEGQTVFPVTVAEKGTLWLKLTATGEAGHGSTPVPTRAPMKLQRAMERLNSREVKPTIHPALYELLARVGEQKKGLTGAVLGSKALVDLLVTGKLMSVPPTRAAITNTCQVTGFEGKGSAANVIPTEVAAIVDCRVLPGVAPEAFLGELKKLVEVEEGVTLTVIQAEPATESTWDDPFFDALVRRLTEGRTDVVVGPAISPGFTDSNIARPKGTKAYGMVPFEIDSELLGSMHGKNERLPVVQLKRGLEILFRAVVDAAGQP